MKNSTQAGARGGVSTPRNKARMLEHGPHLVDAVHGLVTQRAEKYLPG